MLAAVRPGNPTVLPLVSRIGGLPVSDAGVRRATLAKDLATAAGAVPGVSRADVVARRRTVTATRHASPPPIPRPCPDWSSSASTTASARSGPPVRRGSGCRARPDTSS